MWYRFVAWLFKKLSKENQAKLTQEHVDITLVSDAHKKRFILKLLYDIQEGTTSSIDKETAEQVLKAVIKSTGNEITAFVVRK